MEPERHDLLGIVQHRLDRQRRLRPDQRMPMVRHQNITTKQKLQPPARRLQHLDDHVIVGVVNTLEPGSKVDADKEHTIRVAQPMDV